MICFAGIELISIVKLSHRNRERENCNFRELSQSVARALEDCLCDKLTIIKVIHLIDRKKFTAHEIRLVILTNKFGRCSLPIHDSADP